MYIPEFAFTTSKDSEYTMDVQEGYNHFNGKEALAFCRKDTIFLMETIREEKSAGGYYCNAKEVSVAYNAFEGKCNYGTGQQRC